MLYFTLHHALRHALRRVLAPMALMAIAAAAYAADPLQGLLSRVLPYGDDASRVHFTVTERPAAAPDSFSLTTRGGHLYVRANSRVAAAAGLHWYLQHYAHATVTWDMPTARLPRRLPGVDGETHACRVPYRYYLNFCTHSYSMAFWDWERWQQELDWMALHGINLPLVITGFEAVWAHVLMHDYGYATLRDVGSFVPGAVYMGWFFMNNMTAEGGPLPDSWYARRLDLARRIIERAQAYGMEVVVPGYVGMLPADFLERADPQRVAHWQASDIADAGMWCSFRRPAFVRNPERLAEVAARYYAAIDSLFGAGTIHAYAIDPFHEGAVPQGIDRPAEAVTAMWQALLLHDPEALWVAQHWQDNPREWLTHTVPRGRLLILDLHGESHADTVCGGYSTDATAQPHDWVWGMVGNFGGNVGLHGRLSRLLTTCRQAMDGAPANGLKGIGALPEGIDNNPMLYDLLFALPWLDGSLTEQQWVEQYVDMRYGARGSACRSLLQAWQLLARSVYACPTDAQQGTTESVLMQRPDVRPHTVSTWATSSWYWDKDDVRQAARHMLAAARVMAASESFRHDLVDVVRQVLADEAHTLLTQLSTASGAEATTIADRFMQLLLDQDRLLGTRREWRLGTWTEAARSWGDTPAEADAYEHAARALLTTWAGRTQAEQGGLIDYANREWQGLLRGYYYPRWRAFFDNGCRTGTPWFEQVEWPFVEGRCDAPYGSFTSAPEGDAIEVARELMARYAP